ncbi:hypothetical protein BKA58DRAFT_202420 [Alternaria rosae]|uniref:uncharacterized protein n=1 Tax=Alternaria rosae TaxID=1187941 RepID=UPI001E8D89A4|nr:uncharacterized protein BKA58DRAFT_202420 [Alternaria rosae]KAH6866303.1 hypothetical protein BKA58DRAFT_202420 [Alternaria rosae]
MHTLGYSLVLSFHSPTTSTRPVTLRRVVVALLALTPLSRPNKVPRTSSSSSVTGQRVDHTKYLLLSNYSYSHRQPKLTMAKSTSLASWKLRNRFLNIVRSDASPNLDLIPSYHTLEFDYNETENTVALRMGRYGDSEILAHLNGSVSKRRTATPRSAK